jgi:hypothetical protein
MRDQDDDLQPENTTSEMQAVDDPGPLDDFGQPLEPTNVVRGHPRPVPNAAGGSSLAPWILFFAVLVSAIAGGWMGWQMLEDLRVQLQGARAELAAQEKALEESRRKVGTAEQEKSDLQARLSAALSEAAQLRARQEEQAKLAAKAAEPPATSRTVAKAPAKTAKSVQLAKKKGKRP